MIMEQLHETEAALTITPGTCVGRFAAGRAVRCAQWAVQFGRHRHASPNAMASPNAIPLGGSHELPRDP